MITWNEYWEVKKLRDKGCSYQEIVNKLFRNRRTQRLGYWTRKHLSYLMREMDKKAHPKHNTVAEADESFYKHTMKTLDKALDAFEKDHEAVRIHQYTKEENAFYKALKDAAEELQPSHPAEDIFNYYSGKQSKQAQKPIMEPIPTYDGVQKPTGQTFTDPGATSVGEMVNGSYKSDVYYPDCPIRQMKEITNALLDLRAEHDIKLKIFKSYIAEARNELCHKKS